MLGLDLAQHIGELAQSLCAESEGQLFASLVHCNDRQVRLSGRGRIRARQATRDRGQQWWPSAASPSGPVSRKGESAHLVAGLVHDADFLFAVAPELAAKV